MRLILLLFLLSFLGLQPSAAIKVSNKDSQSVVSKLLSETESSALDELSEIINMKEDSTFSLESFDDWLNDYMVDMFQTQSEEDTMFNVIEYKCSKNLQTYSFQVSYDEENLSRVLNNKALCQLQEKLATGDLETSSTLSSHMETAHGSISSLMSARESYYDELYSMVNTIIGQIEESEEIVGALLNGMDSSDVLNAMIQLRANSKEILMQSAKNGADINKGLALVQTMSGSSKFSSYDLVAIQETLAEMKEDVIQMVYSVEENEDAEAKLLTIQQDLIASLGEELVEEMETFESTIDEACDCVEENESDEASLSELLQLEIQKLEDFECLCDTLTEKYSFISEKL